MKYRVIALSLLLASCVSTEGLSPLSSKTPMGNPHSSILVEEFSDFQCPACNGAHQQVTKPILEKYGNVIRYEFRHFPLSQIHPFAQEAAEATECAADQGKFWEFADAIFANQNALTQADLLKQGETLAIADQDLFRRCVQSHIKKNIILQDLEEGKNRGIQGTPTFFINGEVVTRHTPEVIGQIIDDLIAKQRL